MRVGLPIFDDLLAAFTSASLLAENSFPNDQHAWDGKPHTDQTWTVWKVMFLPLHQALEHKRRAATERAYTFGSVTSAIQVHGTLDQHTVCNSHFRSQPIVVDATEQLNQHIDALSAAATTSNTVLE